LEWNVGFSFFGALVVGYIGTVHTLAIGGGQLGNAFSGKQALVLGENLGTLGGGMLAGQIIWLSFSVISKLYGKKAEEVLLKIWKSMWIGPFLLLSLTNLGILWLFLKPTYKIEGAIEGEHLTVLGQSGSFWAGSQDMFGFSDKQNRWSGDSQFFGKATKKGDCVDLGLPVLSDGTYHLVVYLTKANDYGIVKFHLNGKPVGKPIDGFNESQVLATGPIDLGPAELRAGLATLRVEVVGTNPKSKGNRYMWGLDCVLLKKE
jgi:hypothetical protein